MGRKAAGEILSSSSFLHARVVIFNLFCAALGVPIRTFSNYSYIESTLSNLGAKVQLR